MAHAGERWSAGWVSGQKKRGMCVGGLRPSSWLTGGSTGASREVVVIVCLLPLELRFTGITSECAVSGMVIERAVMVLTCIDCLGRILT